VTRCQFWRQRLTMMGRCANITLAIGRVCARPWRQRPLAGHKGCGRAELLQVGWMVGPPSPKGSVTRRKPGHTLCTRTDCITEVNTAVNITAALANSRSPQPTAAGDWRRAAHGYSPLPVARGSLSTHCSFCPPQRPAGSRRASMTMELPPLSPRPNREQQPVDTCVGLAHRRPEPGEPISQSVSSGTARWYCHTPPAQFSSTNLNRRDRKGEP